MEIISVLEGKQREMQIYSVIKKNIDTWGYQWVYARHKNHGVVCVPKVSLIENIGFGEDATHTFGENTENIKRQELDFPLNENNFIIPDRFYDELFLADISLIGRVKNKIKSLFGA